MIVADDVSARMPDDSLKSCLWLKILGIVRSSVFEQNYKLMFALVLCHRVVKYLSEALLKNFWGLL